MLSHISTRLEAILALVLVLFAALFVARITEHICRRIEWKPRLGLTLILSILSLPGLLYCLYYLHLLPEMEWFYQLRSLRGSELWLAIPLSAVVAWSNFATRPFVLFFYALAVGALVVPFAKPLSRPLDPVEFRDQWNGNACLQSTESTCGPASAATVIRYLGKKGVTETSLAINAKSTTSGTEAWYLARELRRRGYVAEFQFNSFPNKISFPGILGVRLGTLGHFIAVLKHEGDQWTIADPLVGQEIVTLQELKRRYSISGFFLHIH